MNGKWKTKEDKFNNEILSFPPSFSLLVGVSLFQVANLSARQNHD
tara:strand:- start:277 stop:411 length:135 start_codon:yes stop_codon:yes gene_type:complete